LTKKLTEAAENRYSRRSHKPSSVGSTPTPATIKCANFMNPTGARKTVEEHQRKYGHPDEPFPYDLSDANIMQNCSMCPFGMPKVSGLLETVAAAAGDLGALIQQDVKRLTGEPLKRVCFLEEKQ
jgi:hypothetical protein